MHQIEYSGTTAIWMRENSSRLAVTGLNITMLQQNVSNAFRIEGISFTISDNVVHQAGECFWPNYGPKSDATPFPPSATVYFRNARMGIFGRNKVYWRCSGFDLDVSDRVVFEDNQIVCTEKGVVPHGNAVSGYDSYRNPSARWWSFTRNALSRPPYHKGTEQNWVQRETLTTDGSGGDSGTAVVLSQEGLATSTETTETTIHMRWLTWQATPRVGLSLLVLAGSGMGQLRRIVDVGPGNGTVVLDGPLDAWVATNSSIVAVIASYGSKIFAGNSFNWTEVVQWYGNTHRGVMADNTFNNCNVQLPPAGGGSIGPDVMGARGECYHGSGAVFFTEFYRNTLFASGGIALNDGAGPTGGPHGTGHVEWQCASYFGPWIRWSVVRSNVLGGISVSAMNVSGETNTLPVCASVRLLSDPALPSSGVVTEQNSFQCPPQGNQSSAGYILGPCDGCVERR
jgi:hypothetical protein